MTRENATSEGRHAVRFARTAESPCEAICVKNRSPRTERPIPDRGSRWRSRIAVSGGPCTFSARADGPAGRGLAAYEEVAAPAEEQTLEAQFQLRCRDLIGEIRSLGFDPNVWVALINSLAAAGAARKLLADHHTLVVTPWLVRRGRPELTLEHEIRQQRWSGLFTDGERAEAARRQHALARRRTGGGAG